MRFSFLFICLFLGLTGLLAQTFDAKSAKDFFNKGNYIGAMEIYRMLLIQEPDNAEYNHKIALCYLRTRVDRKKAVAYLEKTLELPKFEKEALFDMGLAYQLNYQFDEAIEMLERYKSEIAGSLYPPVDRRIETCYTAKEMMKFPLNVKFENLGEHINSPYPDYYPFITSDESFMAFTSRRSGPIEFDGNYPSDIFLAQKEDTDFKKAYNAGNLVNTIYDDQAVGLSATGNMLFVYTDQIKEYGDIYFANRIATSFSKPAKEGNHINSGAIETAAYISSDANTVFFSSNRPGGFGGLDLYMSRKLPNNQWGTTQNLGEQINTPYNEDFPTIATDGQTLYFASEGHTSMGGYDLFKSEWNTISNVWTMPTNLRPPINTPDDDMTISFAENNHTAYLSAFREGGYGDLDIYKITLLDLQQRYTLLRVRMPTGDSLYPYVIDTTITIATFQNEELVGEYKANPINGFYTIALEPGKYKMVIMSRNYFPYTEIISVYEREIYPPEIVRELNLKPKPK